MIPGRPPARQVMQAQYYDRDGSPVSEQRWQELGRQPGYSRTGRWRAAASAIASGLAAQVK